MFRFGAIRFGAGAGVAAGAAAATSSNTETHARVRPSRVAKVVDGRRGPFEEGAEDSSQDEWLSFNMEGDVVSFNKEEVKESIDDIMGITQAGVQHSDDAESIESFGEDADAVIDRSNIAQPSSSSSSAASNIEALAGFTERLLSRPSMQKELIDALKDDNELNNMFGQLAKNKGVEIELFQYPRRQLLPAAEVEEVVEEEVEQGEEMNPIQALIHDIGRGLEAAGEGISKAGDHLGDFLGKTGRWVKNKVQPENPSQDEADGPVGEEELGNAEKVAGAVLCFAGAVMVVLVAKRFGLLRVIRQVVV